jgi:hypothetical protein
MTERAELHRLGDDGSFGIDFSFRTSEVSRDSFEQERNVIEEIVCREDSLRRNGDARAYAAEPLRNELLLNRPQTVREDCGELEWIRIRIGRDGALQPLVIPSLHKARRDPRV